MPSSSQDVDAKKSAFKDASHPFNKPTANTILRSSDNVDFRIRDAILAEASTVFEDMFSLPQLPQAGESRKRKERDEQEYRDGIPVVRVPESSNILENLLRFCYPVEKPKIRSPEELCDTLEASRKYFMEQPEKEIIQQFDKMASDAPLSLYALAARRRWKKDMKVAAKASLSISFKAGTWVPEMKDMDAETYIRLHAYHDACSEAAASAILSHGGPSSYYACSAVTEKHGVWFVCTHDGTTQQVTEKMHVNNLQRTIAFRIGSFNISKCFKIWCDSDLAEIHSRNSVCFAFMQHPTFTQL